MSKLDTRNPDVRKLMKENAELRQILKDWRDTPGNHRDAKWWHDWTDRVNAALEDT